MNQWVGFCLHVWNARIIGIDCAFQSAEDLQVYFCQLCMELKKRLQY